MSVKNPRRVELGIVAAIIISSGLFLRFGYTERNYQRSCAANLKEVGLAMMQYIRDYDEKLPPANAWSRVLLPYARGATAFQCPKFGGGGYAMNRYLGELSLVRVRKPSTEPLLFDSTLQGASASDTGQSWPISTRHRGGNHVCFVDGQVLHLQIKPAFQPFPRSK